MSSNKRKSTNEEIEALLNESDSEFEECDLDDLSDEEINQQSDSSSYRNSNAWNEIDPNKEISHALDGVSNFRGCHKVLGFQGLNPFECFSKFFPESIFNIVADETNRYAAQILEKAGELPPRSRYRKWVNVNSCIIRAFVATEIGMGLVHKPELSLYFQDSYWLTRTPGFNDIFSRDEYQLLRSFLHFENSENITNSNDRLAKIRSILNIVQDLYPKFYNSNKELSVDETMLRFKGRLFFKQYMPSKPSAKWGVKIWSLCDSRTGFLLKFNVYVGKDANKNKKGLSYSVVSNLLKSFKGHCLHG